MQYATHYVTIVTDGSNTPINLAVDVLYGHPATSVLLLNNLALAPQQDSFSLPLGTNKSLQGNTLTIKTNVMKFAPTNNSEVDYTLTGGAPTPSVTKSTAQFAASSNVCSHIIIYNFI